MCTQNYMQLTIIILISQTFCITLVFVFQYQFGYTPLHIAAIKNNVQVARVLIHANADLDSLDKVMIIFHIKQSMIIDSEQFIESSCIYCEPHLVQSMASYV